MRLHFLHLSCPKRGSACLPFAGMFCSRGRCSRAGAVPGGGQAGFSTFPTMTVPSRHTEPESGGRGPAVPPVRIPVSPVGPLAPAEKRVHEWLCRSTRGNSRGTHLTRGTAKARVMPRHAPMCDLRPGNHQPPCLSHWKHACLRGPVWASLSL